MRQPPVVLRDVFSSVDHIVCRDHAEGGVPAAHVTMGSRLLSFRMCDGASISAATRFGKAGRGVLQL